jgi:hypothetical protein
VIDIAAILHFLVAFIYRVFLVNFGDLPLLIINLLPKSYRDFRCIYFLEVPCSPPKTA